MVQFCAMTKRSLKKPAYVGVFDHWGWAVLLTVASNGNLIDRRRVELVDGALPKYPYHHHAQGLPVGEAEALVERVSRSADACAKACFETLAAAVPIAIAGISLRACPPLPETVAERLSNYRAQNVADSVLYREALARAARSRGWFVNWYEAKRVLPEAASALGRETIDDLLTAAGKTIGPPWQKDHRLAMAAAISAVARRD
jgi:hypothetical protein